MAGKKARAHRNRRRSGPTTGNLAASDVSVIVAHAAKYDASEILVEEKGFRIHIKRGPEPAPVFQAPTPAGASPPAVAPPPPAVPPPPPASAEIADAGLHKITSPIVGTFYRSSSPDTPPFVKEGDTVSPDTTVCIIEAMKIMNEIKADVAGVVKSISVKNAQVVEAEQTLFLLQPSS